MIAIAYYLLKVMVCSLILFAYYHLALKNKLFHQWNRYYLLLSILVSVLIPCLSFTIVSPHRDADSIQLLQVVYSADEFVSSMEAAKQFPLTLEQSLYILYTSISLILFAAFSISIYNIFKLVRSHSVQTLESIKLVNTEAKGTPFSFLQFIFWNRGIDMNTTTGRQIFQHELVHVKEKHTLDKIFIQLVLCLFWHNPIFWLIRNELKMIHEFIADKKSVKQANTSEFAAMILQTSYTGHNFNGITNQFFQSSIKRRINMLIKSKNHKVSYLNRILALPVIAVVSLAFTIKAQTGTSSNSISLVRPLTVVIDPGHGAQTGSRFENIYEDDLVLQLAKSIKDANSNSKINIVFTRDIDVNMGLADRVKIARDNKADLFISLHMNAVENTSTEKDKTGVEVLVPGNNATYQRQSELLGSALLKQLSTLFQGNKIQTLGNAGSYVLDKNVCPAVLIQCGYITNDDDRKLMQQSNNQKIIARQILTAIETYAAHKDQTKTEQPIPPDEKNEVASETKEKSDTTDNPLVFIDGKEKGKLKDLGGAAKLMNPDNIKAMFVYKGKEATDKYGQKGKDGVIEIITKSFAPPPPPPAPPTATKKTTEVSIVTPEKILIHTDTLKIRPVEGIVSKVANEALVIIDGKEFGRLNGPEVEKSLKPNSIQAMSVLKGKSATDIYGEKGIYGVIVITTKQ